MKKSLLLYTVSGVLFCSSSSLSYAYNEILTRQPAVNSFSVQTTDDSTTAKKRKRSLSTSATTPKTVSTTRQSIPAGVSSSGNTIPTTAHSSSKAFEKPAENTPPQNPHSTGKTITESTTTEGAKSRRRPSPSHSSTSPTTEEALSSSSAPTQSMPLKPTSEAPPMLTKSEDSETAASPAPANLKAVRPTVGAPTDPKGTKPEIKELSAHANPEAVRLAVGAPPAPVKPMPKQPVPEQPVQPKQGENKQAKVEAKEGKTLELHDIEIQDKYFAVSAEGENSLVKIHRGTVDANFVALSASNGGAIEATGITVTAGLTGLFNINGTINLKDSTITVTSDYGANGIVFRNDPYFSSRQRHAHSAETKSDINKEQNLTNQVTLENTKLFVEKGVAINIYGLDTDAQVFLKNSEIHADLLVKNTKQLGGDIYSLILTADHSDLEGRVRTLGENQTIFDLKNGTKWLLKANKNREHNDKDPSDYEPFGAHEKTYSNLSALKLTDSTIMFETPMNGQYQTLFVDPTPRQEEKESEDGNGSNAAVVYSAKGRAEVHLNSRWRSHSPVTEQATDRLVIHGDVSGVTTVHVNLLESNQKMTDSRLVWGEQMLSHPVESHGISLIQVSGKANENSFKLAGGYLTIAGLPYKYVLTGYAPGASHESQNLFGQNNRDFWDFRLQNDYLDRDKKIRAVLPQVANYVVMPSTLFSAGYVDVNNQNTLLDNIYTTIFAEKHKKKNAIFLSSYGEKVTLSSNRAPLHYGYGADINYNALQGGVILAALEGKDISTHFGLLGTYGKLSFTPKSMEDSEKTTLDKWSLTAYSGVKHSNGLYVNALLSYGALRGNITTPLIGNAAKLDGTEILNVSTTVGQKLATGMQGLMFEPQAQFIYQSLMFDVLSDANNFEVDMNNPHQWLVRIGGRLTQTLTTLEEDNTVSFYSKLNVIKTFGDGGTIKIADTFYLDPMGSSIEGGIGFNAFLSQNIALHGDVSYRQKLQKAGVSGTNFSGGIRYKF
ncbi:MULTISPECIES: autotransporter outer membrane beta-barrel domain-containing protein [unclassified Bartonella]|uniref:autotransporter outer membrane beta-barrel domain-containing protein n=1 Tax=unclassified Bartonella TaxID=2645622 RepID=UPI002361E166|nr:MULTISPECIES: autotransporter outer membrane beta-barrel domain-containing protein [unclassified Bartonella]